MSGGAINSQLSPVRVGLAAKLIPDPVAKKSGGPSMSGGFQTAAVASYADLSAASAWLGQLGAKYNTAYTTLISAVPRWTPMAQTLNGDASQAGQTAPLLNGSGAWDAPAADLLRQLQKDILTAAVSGGLLQAGAMQVVDGGTGLASIDIPTQIGVIGGLLDELARARLTLSQGQGSGAFQAGPPQPSQPQGSGSYGADLAAAQKQIQTLIAQVTTLQAELKTANAAAAAAASVCVARGG